MQDIAKEIGIGELLAQSIRSLVDPLFVPEKRPKTTVVEQKTYFPSIGRGSRGDAFPSPIDLNLHTIEGWRRKAL